MFSQHEFQNFLPKQFIGKITTVAKQHFSFHYRANQLMSSQQQTFQSEQDKDVLSPIQREIQSITKLNNLLIDSYSTLSKISGNLKTLSANFQNSKKLSSTYTQIYKHNQKLNNIVNENLKKNGLKDSVNDELNNKSIDDLNLEIKNLNDQIYQLKNQLKLK